jgi:hypothetical protein
MANVSFVIFCKDYPNSFVCEVSESNQPKANLDPNGEYRQSRPKVTLDYLKEFSFPPVPHPPFSLDLAYSDFFPFAAINVKLAGSEFRSAEEPSSDVTDVTIFISYVLLANVFGEWEQRLQKCIDMERDHVD